jgi:hypothetical protein
VAAAFPTPEQAALSGYSLAAKARVRASAVSAELGRAVVIVDTEPTHPIEVDCIRAGSGWAEGNSGNGWSWASLDHEVGFQTAWDEVPEGVTAVRVEFAGRVSESAVSDGMFLFVDWRVPQREAGMWPHLIGYLRNGVWEKVPITAEQLSAERWLRSRPPTGWRRLLPRRWGVRRISINPPE